MAQNNEPNNQPGGPQNPESSGLVPPSGTPYVAAGTGINASLARLRLLIRSIEQRQQESQRRLNVLRQQFRRIPTLAVNSPLNVETYLAATAESRRCIANLELEVQDLKLLHTHAQRELYTLELTIRIQHNQADLAHLKEQARWDDRPELAEEIKRLESLAQDYALEAGRSITSAELPTLEPPVR
ncbi:MAG: hypothetical protein EXR67_04350 [Dehalococcoidia bacterium]|nr:hypothetical protein [Dehalococcoidia bacterium]